MAPALRTRDGKPVVQVLDDVTNSDLTAARNEYHYRMPYLVDKMLPLLKDPRDEPMLCLLVNIVQVLVPGVVIVYGLCLRVPPASAWAVHAAGLCYVATIMVLFMERFVLCLHFSSHRPIFQKAWMNSAMSWVFAPMFGIPCGLYKLHHCVMHHIENNHELDASSTEQFQRDSWLDFAGYWFRFVFLIHLELPVYTLRTKRYEWFVSVIGGLATWLCVIAFLAKCVNMTATVWVFVVPHFLAMSAMSFGNWAQHVFVDPTNCASNYALTYNCIDTPVNQTTFNDGYHVIHHANARLHWSEMPGALYATREKHLESGALTFRGVHFMDVGVMVMTKQLRKLAECYVHLGTRETAPTVDEVEARLRSWLVPVPGAQAKKAS